MMSTRVPLAALAAFAFGCASGGGEGTIGGAPERTVRVTARELFTLDAANAYVAFSPDGRLLVTGSRGRNPDTPGRLKLWDVATGEQQATLRGHSKGISAVAFSPDGQLLATGGLDHLIKLWDVTSGEEKATMRGHSAWVVEVVFSPDGKTLATSSGVDSRSGYSSDNRIRLWDVETGQEQASFGFEGFIHSDVLALMFSPDGKRLVTGSSHVWAQNVNRPPGGTKGRLTIWDLATGQSRTIHEDPPGAILAVAVTRDGKMMASGGFTRTPRLWDLPSGRELMVLRRQRNWIYTLAFSPDGKILATGSGSTRERSRRGDLILWDTATGEALVSIDTDGHGVTSVAFSPDGSQLAAGMFSGDAKIFRITSENPR